MGITVETRSSNKKKHGKQTPNAHIDFLQCAAKMFGIPSPNQFEMRETGPAQNIHLQTKNLGC